MDLKMGKRKKVCFVVVRCVFFQEKGLVRKKYISALTYIIYIYICIHKYTNFNPHESETFLLKKTYLRSWWLPNYEAEASHFIQMPAVDGAVAKMLHAWRIYVSWDAPPGTGTTTIYSYICSLGPHPKPSLASVSWMGGGYQNIFENIWCCMYTGFI